MTEEEVRRITRALEDVFERPSYWSGRLRIVPDLGANGKKPFGCDILIDQDLAAAPHRWRTVLHEAIHAFSEGYGPAYALYLGWEEGVVELLQREMRFEVLTRAGILYDENAQKAAEQNQAYNKYVEALQGSQSRLAQKE